VSGEVGLSASTHEDLFPAGSELSGGRRRTIPPPTTTTFAMTGLRQPGPSWTRRATRASWRVRASIGPRWSA